MKEREKNAYVEAKLEVFEFEPMDIITSSGDFTYESDGTIDSGSSWDS